ncbi:hypothetical protein CPAV1605_113 [seawater metagenome]|uniref:Uncharacterized protein n=1 Tax=seawater metagenome TaxID=1561972 RepID=A0A5E8CGT7_9ZZZZ
MENSNLKAKYVIWEDLQPLEKNLNNIEQISNEIEYNYGDLVSFCQYSDTHTYIIGKDGNLILNSNKLGLGLLSIPYEITQCLLNATKKYFHTDICVNDIDLRYDDEFILNKIDLNQCLFLKTSKINYDGRNINIKFENGKKYKYSDEQFSTNLLRKSFLTSTI